MGATNEIFISYAWRGESEAMVNDICETLRERFHTYQRDKESMDYRDSIHAFMEEIGRGNYVIAVISDKYMKSEYCMYEAMRMMQADEFEARVFPIVLADADVFSTGGQLGYLKYWKDTYAKIEQDLKAIDDPTLSADFALRLRDIKETTLYVGRFMNFLADRNLLSPEIHQQSDYAQLIALIEKRMGVKPIQETPAQEKPDPIRKPPPPEVPAAHPASHYAGELKDLRSWAERKRLVLFLGADLPADLSGLPSHQQLANSFAMEYDLPGGQSLQSVTQQVMRAGNRFAFTQFLKTQLRGKQPGPFFRALADFVRAIQPEWLLSMAYHRLLEMALEEDGDYSLQVVTADNQLPFIERNAPALLKLFGDIQHAEMIVTEQDVNEFLQGRTNNRSEIFKQMESLLKQNCILFVGHDLQNPDVRRLIDLVSNGQFQIPSYAVASGLSDGEITAFESNRGLKVLDSNPFDVLTEISA